MTKRALIALLVLVLAVVACGDDESIFTGDTGQVTTSSADLSTTMQATTAPATTSTGVPGSTLGGGDQAVADLIADALLADAAAGGPDTPIDEESARCVANGMVAEVGAGRLQELGVEPGGAEDAAAVLEQMTEAEVASVVDVVLGCIDMRAFIIDGMVASGISPEGAACVADGFLEGPILQELIVSAVGSPEGEEMSEEAFTLLFQVMMRCLTPEELANMGGLEGIGG